MTTVLHNARIRTLDPARPTASALAVDERGRIAAVGGDELLDDATTGAADRVDLHGAAVLPGFVDVHNHHAVAGRAALFELALPPEASLDTVLDSVRTHAQGIGAEEWIVGGSWPSWLVPRLAGDDVAGALDDAAGGRPVVLGDDSHHNRWASPAALRLAGIHRDTVDPPGGRIVRDARGEPTGLLFEAAGLPVESALAATRVLSAEQHAACSAEGIAQLNRYGITAFQDAGADLDILGALRDLDRAGRLDAWVVSSLLVNDLIFGSDPVGERLVWRGEEFRTEHHRPDFVKIFLDGVPPTRTGAFLEAYLPDDAHGAHHHGATTMDADELLGWLLRTAERGLSAKIHCTGDAAVRAALDAVAVVRERGFTAPRYHIAHGQFVADDDIPRFARLDVVADISPFLWFPGAIPDALAAVLPPEVAAHAQPNRSLLDAGALIAGGSDWPVCETPDPLVGIQGLVTRADPSGARPGTLWAEQAVSVDEAIAAFTASAAHAMDLDEVTGSLRPGLSADLVVLSADPGAVDPSRIAALEVRETWFAGRRVHQR